MLREWSVSGFKSIKNARGIQLRKVNVFAGANSSGKSSLLQSILLLKQTLQYGAQNRPLSLNGPILRLGALQDILFSSAEDTTELNISFKFELPSQVPHPGAPWMDALVRRSWANIDSDRIREIRSEFSWSPAKPVAIIDQTPARLQTCLNTGIFAVERSAPGGESNAVFEAKYTPRGSGASEDWFNVKLDKLSQAEVFGDRPDPSVDSTYVTHFLPSWVQVRFDAVKQKAHDLVEAMFESRSMLGSSTAHREAVPEGVLQIINNWLKSTGEPLLDVGKPVTAEDVADRLEPFVGRRYRTIGSPRLHTSLTAERALELRALQDDVEVALQNEFGATGQRWDSDLQQPRTLGSGVEFVRSYFKSGVRYLGPLRDEPRPVYPLEALENTTDVGYRGEHTAAVLELNANARISYVPSASFKEDAPNPRVIYTTLKKAVVDWLVYMGVAQDVDAREEGVFGNRLQVTTAGLDKFHDLTNVGVGVSQVLPIIVSSLLAPTTSLLLFEQPELHLHPRVQARLADFFLAIAMSGRQCILETHSEYLVERFRRRIAESEDDSLDDVLAIYFAERERGETKFRPVVVTKYGAIEDWPDEFFDQSQREASRILEAAARKRAKDRQKS